MNIIESSSPEDSPFSEGKLINEDAPTTPTTSIDTTPKSNTEMLMNSEQRLRLLEDNVRDFAIIELASDGRIAHWNLGAERILGYQEEEIVGQNIAVIFTPEDRAAGKDVQEIEGAVAYGRAMDECWHLKKDGTRFWASGIMTGPPPDSVAMGTAGC